MKFNYLETVHMSLDKNFYESGIKEMMAVKPQSIRCGETIGRATTPYQLRNYILYNHNALLKITVNAVGLHRVLP